MRLAQSRRGRKVPQIFSWENHRSVTDNQPSSWDRQTHIKSHKCFPHTHSHTTARNMMFFGEKNTFIFFKYMSIDKDSLALFHCKDEMIPQVSKGNFIVWIS